LHEGLPDLGFAEPHQYLALSESARAVAKISSDLCIIGDDYFVRGVVELPILGSADHFGIGVWVSLKRENFERYVELFEATDLSGEGPFFGWLCNRIAGYPDTLNLKTRVHLRPAPARPRIELEPTDHPLSVHQRQGIALADVQALVEPTFHPDGAA
jgi:hypothetical protein